MTREDQWRDHFHATVRQRDRWIQHCDELDVQVVRLREAGDKLADALRGLDSYAAMNCPAPKERTERADAALRAWSDATGDKRA